MIGSLVHSERFCLPLPARRVFGQYDGGVTDALSITGLRFAYDETFRLHIPSFTVKRGEHVLLQGPSGCGKSTLLHCCAGLLAIESGSITIAGESMSLVRGAVQDERRGRLLGMVFQTHHLLVGFTARENVELAMLFSSIEPSSHHKRAEMLLERLELPSIDRPIETLSVGQQQRVALARAVAGKPPLLLADEPTASLDPPTAHAAMEMLLDVAEEESVTVLLSTHDPSHHKRFERIVQFEDLQ